MSSKPSIAFLHSWGGGNAPHKKRERQLAPALVQRAQSHLAHGAQEDHDRAQVFAHDGDSLPLRRQSRLACAGTERQTVASFDPHMVRVAFRRIGDFVQARLVTAD